MTGLHPQVANIKGFEKISLWQKVPAIEELRDHNVIPSPVK